MIAKMETSKPSPFRDGFLDVIQRAFSLDFSPRDTLPPPPPPPPDPRPGWERDAENLRRDWERVGGYLWGAIGRVEAENPDISRGFYGQHLHEAQAGQ